MNGKWLFLTGCILFFTGFSSAAQTDWELKAEKEGIQVYTKQMDSSPLKTIKAVFTISTSLAGLTAVLMDINSSMDWVYATKKIALLKKISPAELVYYSEIEIPWPVSNRDFIVDLIVSQDEKTKVVTVAGRSKPGYLPVYKNIVRIRQSYSKWLITPLQNGLVKIEYLLEVDPGGSVPAWLINLFAAKGPFETCKKLREQVRKPAYSHINLPFIKE